MTLFNVFCGNYLLKHTYLQLLIKFVVVVVAVVVAAAAAAAVVVLKLVRSGHVPSTSEWDFKL